MTCRQKQAPATVGDISEVANVNYTQDVSAKVLAGECAGVKAHYENVLDENVWTLQRDRLNPPHITTAIVYVYKSTFAIGPQAEKATEVDTCLLWKFGSSVWFQNVGSQEGTLVLVAG